MNVSLDSPILRSMPNVAWFSVGPQCMLGEGSQLSYKCNVKRSIIGCRCRIGSGVKAINIAPSTKPTTCPQDHIIVECRKKLSQLFIALTTIVPGLKKLPLHEDNIPVIQITSASTH